MSSCVFCNITSGRREEDAESDATAALLHLLSQKGALGLTFFFLNIFKLLER